MGASGKDPIAFWSLCQKQPRDLPCLPGLLPPTLHLHRPGRPGPAPASASQPLRDGAAQTSPLPAASPFLVALPWPRKGPGCHSPPRPGERT